LVNILSEKLFPLIKSYLRKKPLLAFDFDGTLAPITENPEDASIPPSTRDCLRDLAKIYPCAVISGRGRKDLVGRLNGIPLRYVIGNHGVEWESESEDSGEIKKLIADWESKIRPKLEDYAGIEIENKSYSLSIHYRKAKEKTRAMAEIGRALSGIGPAAVIGGKEVVNMLPENAPTKADAFSRVLRLLKCSHAIFIGDDTTDEDIFRKASKDNVLGVRVGRSRKSQAHYYLESQSKMDKLLKLFLSLFEPEYSGAETQRKG